MNHVTKILYGIGGGLPTNEKMSPHLQRVVEIAQEHSKGDKPKLALLPTAHHNGLHPALPFRSFFRERFTELGASVTEILIGEVGPDEHKQGTAEIQRILDSSDLLFVLNGDTQYLMVQVQTLKLKDVFLNAYERGLPFAGSSAGFLWLGETSMSDSQAYDNPDRWDFITVKGLGIIKGLLSCHDNQGVRNGVDPAIPRNERFERMVLESDEQRGIAVDEFVALEIRDGICSVRSTDPDAWAYELSVKNGTIERTRMG